MNKFLEAALEYREAGLHPIPVMPRGKRPAISSWKQYQDTMPTVEEITAWWTANPDANIALVMGRGAFALDVDGAEAFEALRTAGVKPDPTTPCSKTSRGYHFFYAGSAVADRIGLLPHVDIRGLGYVVAPPSIHESGHEYVWITPITGSLPQAPDVLWALLGKSPGQERVGPQGGTDWLTAALVGVSEGGRDQTCTRLAGYLLGKGISQEATDLILQRWAEDCEPPFPADQVSKCVASIAKREGAPEGPPSSLAEALDVALAEIGTPREQKRVIKTGLAGLDEALVGGFYPGNYVLLGARPSVGKTALALQIGRQRAKEGFGVLIVTRDSTKTDLVRRLLSQEGQINASDLRAGTLVEVQKLMLQFASESLRPLPVWVTSDISTADQMAEAMDVYTPGTLGLVIVDYLQLLNTARETRDSRQRVERISKDIKALGIRHEVPMLVLSSLARPERDNPHWRPSLASLRESGELEHDADTVLLMHRNLLEPLTEVQVAKQKDGPVGTINLQFNANIVTFTEAA